MHTDSTNSYAGDKRVAVWAKRIRAPMRKTIEGLIETGNVLAECKAALEHGQYLTALDLVGFNIRRAQKLTRIARNPILSNASNFTHLPPCVESLYLLSRLDDADLQGALETGRIRPDTRLREVQTLLAENAQRGESGPRVRLTTPRPAPTRTRLSDRPGAAGTAAICVTCCRSCPTTRSTLSSVTHPIKIRTYGSGHEIAEQAARLLVPGGSLLTLCGHYQVPTVANTMSEHLEYWWLAGMGHGSSLQRMHGARVAVAWKPALWFVKDFHRGPRTGKFPVDLLNGERDKAHHEWGRPVSWFAHWIERLTEPGEIILDPTSGAGTTLVAATEKGRRAIGVEIDFDSCRTAAKRLAGLQENEPQSRHAGRRRHKDRVHVRKG